MNIENIYVSQLKYTHIFFYLNETSCIHRNHIKPENFFCKEE